MVIGSQNNPTIIDRYQLNLAVLTYIKERMNMKKILIR